MQELERSTADVVEALRLASRLLRALTPVAAQMRGLQDALGELQSATEPLVPPSSAGTPPAAGPPARPFDRAAVAQVPVAARPTAGAPETPEAEIGAMAPAPEPAAAPERSANGLPTWEPAFAERPLTAQEEPSAAASAPALAPDLSRQAESDEATPSSYPPQAESAVVAFPGARRDMAEAIAEAEADTEPAPARAPAQSTVRRTVSVTVARSDGPLDLVRVHSALEAMPGVTGLALTSYTRGRAGIMLETERPGSELPLHDALLDAFPEGVTGRWEGEGEYTATIGAAGNP
jgi:hypothetical protein